MNSFDVAQMIEPKEDKALLKALYGTIKAVHANGTADVLIDGSTSPQRLINWSSGQVGARCMIAMRGTDWVVISARVTQGAQGASLSLENQPANEIPNGANLNTYTTPGVYQCSASANTSNITNMPIAGYAFKLIVEKPLSGGYKTQIFRRFDKENIFIRSCDNTNTTWYAWQRLAPLADIYPVGAVYIAYTSTSPASLFGGTWTAITGRFPYFNAGTATGGSNTHKLTENEMPSHRHNLNWYYGGSGGFALGFLYNGASNSMVGSDPAPMHNTGGGAAHNNMPAYQTLYAWRRTA